MGRAERPAPAGVPLAGRLHSPTADRGTPDNKLSPRARQSCTSSVLEWAGRASVRTVNQCVRGMAGDSTVLSEPSRSTVGPP